MAKDLPLADTKRHLTLRKKQKLMGQVVLVTHQLVRDRGACTTWRVAERPQEDQRAAWVVGFSWKCNGHIEDRRTDFVSGHIEDPEWHTTSTVPVVLVRYWTGGTEIPIPETGFIHPTDRMPVHPNKKEWEEYKRQEPEGYDAHMQQLREEALQKDRDEKGRFK